VVDWRVYKTWVVAGLASGENELGEGSANTI